MLFCCLQTNKWVHVVFFVYFYYVQITFKCYVKYIHNWWIHLINVFLNQTFNFVGMLVFFHYDSDVLMCMLFFLFISNLQFYCYVKHINNWWIHLSNVFLIKIFILLVCCFFHYDSDVLMCFYVIILVCKYSVRVIVELKIQFLPPAFFLQFFVSILWEIMFFFIHILCYFNTDVLMCVYFLILMYMRVYTKSAIIYSIIPFTVLYF